jgi:hypothetical protein
VYTLLANAWTALDVPAPALPSVVDAAALPGVVAAATLPARRRSGLVDQLNPILQAQPGQIGQRLVRSRGKPLDQGRHERHEILDEGADGQRALDGRCLDRREAVLAVAKSTPKGAHRLGIGGQRLGEGLLLGLRESRNVEELSQGRIPENIRPVKQVCGVQGLQLADKLRNLRCELGTDEVKGNSRSERVWTCADRPKMSEPMFCTSVSINVKFWLASSSGLGNVAGTCWRRKA